MWQRWHSIGTLATSIRSLFEPCASWQVTQLSRPTLCSHRNGPRFSAWQVAHASVTDVPSLSIFTFCDPCGLWQVVHSILVPLNSPTGMWDDLWTLLTSLRWHCTHVSVTDSVFSCAFSDFGAWTLWQVTQPTLRLSCLPPSKLAWLLRLWQDRHAALASRSVIVPGFLILVLSPPPSTCAWPGP